MPPFSRFQALMLIVFCLLGGLQPLMSQQIVQDSSFEEGHPNTHWVESSTNFSSIICSSNCGNCQGQCFAHSGSNFAWLGGSSVQPETGSVEQNILIPVANYAVLEFFLKTPFIANNIDDNFQVMLDSMVLFNLTTADSSSFKKNYRKVSLNIASFADGKYHKLKFRAYQTGSPSVTHFLLDDVSVQINTGIAKATDLKLQFYPNPASKIFYLNLNQSKALSLEIYSVDGKKMSHLQFKSSYRHQVNIAHLPKGIYFLKIKIKGEAIRMEKLIVK